MASVEPGAKSTRLATLGAVFTAIIGSACCWLPLLLIAFGFSAAGVGSFFEAYRPFFLSAAFLLLAFAWYVTYRPAIGRAWMPLGGKEAQGPAEVCCIEEGAAAAAQPCCPTAASRRRWFQQIMLWVATGVVIAFAFFPSYLKFFLAGGGDHAPVANSSLVRTTTFAVRGMTCEGCAALVENTVKDIPGVLSAKVDYDQNRMVVSTQACCPVPVEPIVQALKKAGYRGEVVSDSPLQTGQ